TLDFLSRAATPLFSFLTMPSFHATVCDRSMAGLAAVMPSVPPFAALDTVSNFDAAWMMALDGMQPTFRQVPPRPSPPSTRIVSRSNWPQRMPATYPPVPAPMIRTLVLIVSAIKSLKLSAHPRERGDPVLSSL